MVSVEFFIDIILSAALRMALGGRGRWCVGLKDLPPSCSESHEIWEPRPSAALRASSGLYRDCILLPPPPTPAIMPSSLDKRGVTQDRNCRGWRCL